MGFGMSLLMTLIITYVNTGFDINYFKRFLKALGIPMVAKGSSTGVSWSKGKNYYWRNKDIIIITANNPITGKYYAPDRRSPEKNYASYVGIEARTQELMDKVVKLFKQNTKLVFPLTEFTTHIV